MRRPVISLLLLIAGAATTSVAAPPGADFEEFRRGLLSDFANFREGILNDYAKFLDSAWEDFERFKAESRNDVPKPENAPVAEPQRTVAPALLPQPEPAPEPAPAVTPRPVVDPAPAKPTARKREFDFHGVKLAVADCNVMLRNRLADSSAFASQWRALLSDPKAADLTAGLAQLARELGLNDYLTFDLVRTYVGQCYPAAHSTARAALSHFIMTGLGYDVRIALNGDDGVLLVPTMQTVYGRPYMMINGRKFYVFAESDSFSTSNRISTCRLPDDAETGRPIDLRISSPLHLPYKAHAFNLEYNGISLSGELNGNIFPMLYRYPQTDMNVYAVSVLDPALRTDLVAQLKAELENRTQLDAVNALLQFTQNAIDYATDDTSHGFEKPYFLEEWLYYPENDCEDRAVFYTYMLWNVLGVECQMITYPGHESAAVRLNEPIEGDHYVSSGTTFYISDPTYIDAKTGQCMPGFIETAPEIEYHYRRQ